MGTETLPPLCMSALGAIALLLVAGLVPWIETVLLLGAIAVFHSLPHSLMRLHSKRLIEVRVAKRAIVRSRQ